ncbi:Calcium-dependent protein kinase [Entamoeba marina]
MRELTYSTPIEKLAFCAPELLRDMGQMNQLHQNHLKQDIWSLGMICFFIMCGGHPFQNFDTLNRLIKGEPIDFSVISDPSLRDLLQSMLCYDENNRISFNNLMNHPFVIGSFSLMHNPQSERSFKYIKTIGSGKFGRVFQAIENHGLKRMVAIKEIRNCDDDQVLRESRIMCMCNHPNLVQIYDYFSYEYPLFTTDDMEFDGNKFHYIVMEYCDCDMLSFSNDRTFSSNDLCNIFKQLTQGIHYLLVVERIFHRDLKLENFLLKQENGEFVVKISDYGLSKMDFGGSVFDSYVGTPEYMAPEVSFVDLKGNYTNSSDVYSLGVCMYYLATKKWPPARTKDLAWICMDANISNELVFPEGIHPQLCQLIQRMVEINVKKRITWDEIFKHDFVVNYLHCSFQNKVQPFVKSTFPPSQHISNTESCEVLRSPGLDIYDMEETEYEDDSFDDIIQCFKSNDEFISDEWSLAFTSVKNKKVTVCK